MIYYISRLYCFGTGVLYPGYMSYKAVKAEEVDAETLKKMLKYWVAFSLFSAAECVSDIFVSWFPFYYIIKMAFVSYLAFSPAAVSVVYDSIVAPFLQDNEEDIDRALGQATITARYYIVTYLRKALQFVQLHAAEILVKIASTNIDDNDPAAQVQIPVRPSAPPAGGDDDSDDGVLVDRRVKVA